MEKLKEILSKEKFILLILFLVCAVMFFYKLGSYSLIDVDEPRYAEAAREMLKSGNWITPYFNFELRFDKPVFTYWLIALSYITFGLSEFAARFPSALLASLLVFFTYYFGRTTVSKSFGFISAIVLATSLEVIAIGRMSMTDMPLSFFICATIMSGFLGSFVEENKRKYWWWTAYLFSAFAVLTKGPIGFALPAMVFATYFILTGTLKDNLKAKFLIPGLAVLTLVATPWYYLIIKEHGMNFVDYFFLKHNLARFSSDKFGQHSQPFYFYFIVLFAGFFPWSLYLVSSLINSFKQLTKYFSERKFNFKQNGLALFKDADKKLKVVLYLVIWFLVIFLFFSSSRAKLLTYILPVFPAVAMLTAFLQQDYIDSKKHSKSILAGTIIFSVLCLAIALILQFAMNLILPNDYKIISGNIGIASTLLFFIIPVLAFISYKKDQRVLSFTLIVLFMCGVVFTAVNKILPIVSSSGPNELVEYAEFYKNINLQEKEILGYGLLRPSIVFYSQSKVNFTDDINSVKKQMSGKRRVLVIVRTRSLDEIAGNLKFKLLKKGIKYSLLSNYES